MAGGIGFIAFTTEVAPGAGTRVAAIQLPDGSYAQVIVLLDNPLSTPIQQKGSGVTTPGAPQDLIDFTTEAARVSDVRQVVVVARVEGSFIVTANGQKIGEGMTGPASPNGSFTWISPNPINAGVDVKVTFTACQGTRPGAPVSAYLQGSSVPA